ncbi:MAG: PAS domain S-box protein [Bacteroidia bacterium]|nr:PAS domain S-box protein [Bacteroidia bacterium]
MATSASKLGIHEYNVPQNTIQWDARVRELWGIGPDEPVNYEIFMAGLHPDDRSATQSAVDKALDPSQNGFYEAEFRVINRIDGKECWVLAQGQTWFEDNKPMKLLGTVQDITERIRIKEALRESEAKYRTLFNSIDEGYFLVEVVFNSENQPTDILYLDANPSAIRMVGQDSAGRKLPKIDLNYEPYWYEVLGRVARTGVSERLERYAEPDKKWYDFYVFKVGDYQNRPVAVVFQDITERKQREANLAFLSEITETLSQFSGVGEIILTISAKIGAFSKFLIASLPTLMSPGTSPSSSTPGMPPKECRI